MSLPTVPDINPDITLDRCDAINLLLSSIAMEEIGLSHILNAEGEKLQTFLKNFPCDFHGYIKLNDSVNTTLRTIVKSQILLQFKLEDVITLNATSGCDPCLPKKCCEPHFCNSCKCENCKCQHRYCEKCNSHDCKCKHHYCEKCKSHDCQCKHHYCEKCKCHDCKCKHHYCKTCKCQDCKCRHETCKKCKCQDCKCRHETCKKCKCRDCKCKHDDSCVDFHDDSLCYCPNKDCQCPKCKEKKKKDH